MTHRPLDEQVRMLREALSSLVLTQAARDALLDAGMSEALLAAQGALRSTGSRRDKDETHDDLEALYRGPGGILDRVAKPDPVAPGPAGAATTPAEAVLDTPRHYGRAAGGF